MGAIGKKVMLRHRLKQVGNTMQAMPEAQVPPRNNNAGPWCPCWRRDSDRAPPPIVDVPFPFTSNQEMIEPVRT